MESKERWLTYYTQGPPALVGTSRMPGKALLLAVQGRYERRSEHTSPLVSLFTLLSLVSTTMLHIQWHRVAAAMSLSETQ